MQPPRLFLVLPIVAVLASAGCKKVAPQAVKAISPAAVGAEQKAAVQMAGRSERPMTKAGLSGVGLRPKSGPNPLIIPEAGHRRVYKLAKKVEEWYDDIDQAADVIDFFLGVYSKPSPQPPFGFPHNASAVVPIGRQGIIIRGKPDVYALPNNFGGLSFYLADGRPLGFCAMEINSLELRFFDSLGNGI